MTFVRWTVRWGDVVLATGTGAIPPEYGLPQPRVVHGDRAVVRNGQLWAEAVLAPRPDRPFLWGVPDLQFAKVLVMCLMAFAAAMVLVRERIEALKVERPEIETDIFEPRLAHWSGHSGFTRTSPREAAIPSKDLERIKRFSSKVKELKQREAFAELLAPARPVAVGMTLFSALSDSNNVAVLGGISGAEVRGEAFGGLGLSGRVGGGGDLGGGSLGGAGRGEAIGLGSIGLGSIGLGSIGLGSIGYGSALGAGSGYGRGGIAGGLGSRRSRLRVDRAERMELERVHGRIDACIRSVSSGTVTTELELFEDGRVRTVTVEGVDDEAKRCLMRTLEPLQFSSGERVVSARWTVD